MGHGSSTASAGAGDDTGIGTSANDGMAPRAKIIEMDIGNVSRPACSDQLWYFPADIGDMYLAGYSEGARIFSSSWGEGSSNYTLWASQIDRFVWNHPNAALFFAAGNNPPLVHVTSPSTSKDGLSVGAAYATATDAREWVLDVSAGPTADGRRKPDINTIFRTTSF